MNSYGLPGGRVCLHSQGKITISVQVISTYHRQRETLKQSDYFKTCKPRVSQNVQYWQDLVE